MRSVARLALVAVLALLLVPVTAAAAPSAAPVSPPSDVSGLVDIGGRRLYLECRGQGSPTVVLEAGYGNPGAIWNDTVPDLPSPAVLPGVASFTRVCTYDRPDTFLGSPQDDFGRSRSDAVAQPRDVPGVVTDLHALLHAAAVPGPFVLAGVDLGGDIARLYAHMYPEEVVGLILVDARPDGLLTTVEPRLNDQQWETLRTFLDHPQISIFASDALLREYGLENYDFAALDGVLRAAMMTPLHPMPLAVLANGAGFGLPGTEMELGYSQLVLADAWRIGQESLPALVPGARFFVAANGSYGGIPARQPALVIEAIRQVVAGVRDTSTWDGLVACCTK